MARDDPMMRFRAPTHLKERIEEAAAKNGRSLNSEIVQRLEESFEPSSIPEIVTLYSENSNVEHVIVNLTLACDALEYSEELLNSTLKEVGASDLDKALSRHEAAKARKHFDLLAHRARTDLSAKDLKRLPDYVLARIQQEKS